MKKFVLILNGLFTFIFLMLFSSNGQTNKEPLMLKTIYDGRTPCRYFAEYLKEPVREECIKIKWRLVLFRENKTSESGTYELTGFVFRRDQPTTGRWETVKGSAEDAEAEIIRVNIPGKKALMFLKLDENVLFFLDKNNQPLVGNRDFSFTLNRMKEEWIGMK